jgi:hypothetical protein
MYPYAVNVVFWQLLCEAYDRARLAESEVERMRVDVKGPADQ